MLFYITKKDSVNKKPIVDERINQLDKVLQRIRDDKESPGVISVKNFNELTKILAINNYRFVYYSGTTGQEKIRYYNSALGITYFAHKIG